MPWATRRGEHARFSSLSFLIVVLLYIYRHSDVISETISVCAEHYNNIVSWLQSRIIPQSLSDAIAVSALRNSLLHTLNCSDNWMSDSACLSPNQLCTFNCNNQLVTITHNHFGSSASSSNQRSQNISYDVFIVSTAASPYLRLMSRQLTDDIVHVWLGENTPSSPNVSREEKCCNVANWMQFSKPTQLYIKSCFK